MFYWHPYIFIAGKIMHNGSQCEQSVIWALWWCHSGLWSKYTCIVFLYTVVKYFVLSEYYFLEGFTSINKSILFISVQFNIYKSEETVDLFSIE